ncbi:MAG: hypothetical protein H0V02_01530 [Nocardioidaceae bacterium]|nr:hypothetical protein [Nocardioidaceae bacterium]
MLTSIRTAIHDTLRIDGRHHRWLSEHRPFLIALTTGVALRVVVQLAFTPALIFSDGPLYLSFLDTFEPRDDRPAGYGLLLLYPLSWITDNVLAVVVTQHLMGLTTAVLMYSLLRRWGVGRWPATLATMPVLFDALQLLLEHSAHSDTLFELLLMLAMLVLGWRRRPTPGLALAAGLLLGASATVRLVGEALVLAGVAYCLFVGDGWRRRLAATAALALGFALPVGAYATWYHSERGSYALAEFGGKSLYLRTTTFVDCSRLSVPDYQRVLCPVEPLGQRLEPTYYVWHDERTLPRLKPPPGTKPDQAMREFAVGAIREQPADYALIVLRDFALNFDPWRTDRFEYDTADKWKFSRYLDVEASELTIDAYDEHGGEQLAAHQPYANALIAYQGVGYLPGPLLLGCLALGLAGGLGIGQARKSGLRSICLLMTLTGTGLLLVPDFTAEFTWRYQLPALLLLPAGAALGYTALRGGQLDAGTPATARTD